MIITSDIFLFTAYKIFDLISNNSFILNSKIIHKIYLLMCLQNNLSDYEKILDFLSFYKKLNH